MTAPPLTLPGFGGEAACAKTDPDAFFPEPGTNATQAKRICNTCPVRAECLEWAVAHGEAGVWGGTSERERRGMKPRRPLPVQLVRHVTSQNLRPINHGTQGGYTAHYRRHELPVCEPCREAQSAAKAARQQKRGAA